MSYEIEIYRDGKFIKLVGERSEIDELLLLIKPYIGVRQPCSPQDCWKIYLGTQHLTQTDGLKSVYKDSELSPRNTLLYCEERKLIVIAHTEKKWRIMFALRKIRNLFRWLFYLDSYFFVHGGVVELNKKGVAILGGKKAGKTSTILSLISSENASFVTNDDLTINVKGEKKVEGLGWPRSIGVRPDTLIKLSENQNDLFDKLGHLVHPCNSDSRLINMINSDEIAFFYPKEITKIGNNEVLEKTNLNYVIFPEFKNNENGTCKLTRLNPDKYRKMLMNNIQKIPDKHSTLVHRLFNPPPVEQIEKQIDVIVQSIPGYKLEQNFNNLKKGSELIVSLTQDPTMVSTNHQIKV